MIGVYKLRSKIWYKPQNGDRVSFKEGDETLKGKITSVSEDIVSVKTDKKVYSFESIERAICEAEYGKSTTLKNLEKVFLIRGQKGHNFERSGFRKSIEEAYRESAQTYFAPLKKRIGIAIDIWSQMRINKKYNQ